MRKNFTIQTYLIKTYGCQMNYSDSERIETVLTEAGLKKAASEEKADLIIFNTCSVRQSAEDRVLGLGKNIRKLKQNRKENYKDTKLPITVLTGCMARRCHDRDDPDQITKNKEYLKKIKQRVPFYDMVVPINKISNLPCLLDLTKTSTSTQSYLNISPLPYSPHKISIPISTGCNNFCSYCVVPFARGKLQNRPFEEIYNNIKKHIEEGYKDIWLLGQSVNCWKHRDKTFTDLLKEVDGIKGRFWLSFLSSHPKYFSLGLIDYFVKSANTGTKLLREKKELRNCSHLRPYLNIALQSGSDRILKKMNRKYTLDEFTRLCKNFKEKIPNINLSTDIIVGFPGETKEDFEMTFQAMEIIRFDMAYLNKYSPRDFTASANLSDTVSWKEKKRREEKLNKILKKTALENNQRYIGRELPVMVERTNNNKYSGKTWNFKDIKFESKESFLPGEIVYVKVVQVTPWALEGLYQKKQSEIT